MRYFFLACLTSCVLQYGTPIKPISLQSAAESTFRVDIVGFDGQSLGSGTAWIVEYTNNTTYLITAGHVCAGDDKSYFKLFSKNSKSIPVDVVRFKTEPDLCLLSYKGWINYPIPLASKDPNYGAETIYVGAPGGIYGYDMAPFFKGNYVGWHYVNNPASPGVSGSAVWTSEGVFGTLVAVNTNFHHLSFFVSRQDLVNFLNEKR